MFDLSITKDSSPMNITCPRTYVTSIFWSPFFDSSPVKLTSLYPKRGHRVKKLNLRPFVIFVLCPSSCNFLPFFLQEEKKSLKERLQAIQEVTQTVQNSIGYIASLCERVKNLFNFTVPYLSYLAVILAILGAVVLYFIPLRYLILTWGVNKFSRKIIRPHSVPNNELLDLVSRVPDDEELLNYRSVSFFFEWKQGDENKIGIIRSWINLFPMGDESIRMVIFTIFDERNIYICHWTFVVQCVQTKVWQHVGVISK